MKLLRNKSFVIMLAIVAVGVVTKNIILPLFHSVRPSSRIENNGVTKELKGEVFQQIEPIENEYAEVADFNNMEWAHDYLRDPFRALTTGEAETVSVANTDASVDSGEGSLPIQDFLVAIVHESGRALAVINDVIVSEGDYYDDYKVIKIGFDSVKLEGPDGYKMLEF